MTESKKATFDPQTSLTVMVRETGEPTVAVVTKLVTEERVPHTIRKGETVTLADVIAKGDPTT